MSKLNYKKIRDTLTRVTKEEGISAALKDLSNVYAQFQDDKTSIQIAKLSTDIIKAGLESKEQGYIADTTSVLTWYSNCVGSLTDIHLDSAIDIINAALEDNTDRALLHAGSTLAIMTREFDRNIVCPHALRVFNAAQKHETHAGLLASSLSHDTIAETTMDVNLFLMTLNEYVENVATLKDPFNSLVAMRKVVSMINPNSTDERQNAIAFIITPMIIKIMDAAATNPADADNQTALTKGITVMRDYNTGALPQFQRAYNKHEMLLSGEPLREHNEQLIKKSFKDFIAPN